MKLKCCKLSHNPYLEEMVTEIPERVFIVDGYHVGDRLLEGVMFQIHFDENNKIIKIEVEDDAKPYFNQLNQGFWLEEVRKYAEIIIREGDEVDVPEFIEKKYFKDGINVAYIEL